MSDIEFLMIQIAEGASDTLLIELSKCDPDTLLLAGKELQALATQIKEA